MPNILVDAGPLVAMFDRRDQHHAAVMAFLKKHKNLRFHTTWPPITEAAYILQSVDISQQIALMRWIIDAMDKGLFVIDPLQNGFPGILAYTEKYRDQPMDLADASLTVLAEKTGIHEILTVDHQDFGIYRLPGKQRFVDLLAGENWPPGS